MPEVGCATGSRRGSEVHIPSLLEEQYARGDLCKYMYSDYQPAVFKEQTRLNNSNARSCSKTTYPGITHMRLVCKLEGRHLLNDCTSRPLGPTKTHQGPLSDALLPRLLSSCLELHRVDILKWITRYEAKCVQQYLLDFSRQYPLVSMCFRDENQAYSTVCYLEIT